jgi:hypothetical protein
MTDLPYLVFAAGSLALLIAWSRDENRSWAWAGAAGLVAGASWGIRFVGMTLLAAEGCFLLAHLFWMRPRRVLGITAVWAAGAVLAAGPFALRMLLAGPLETPSDGGEGSIWLGTQKSLYVILRELTTVMWSTPLKALMAVLLAAGLAALVFFVVRHRHSSAADLRDWLRSRRTPLLLGGYVVLSSAMVIVSARQLGWSLAIDQRYFVPVFWVIWMGLAALVVALPRRLRLGPKAGRAVIVILLIGAALLQVRLTTATPVPNCLVSLRNAIGEDGIEVLTKEVRPDQIVLSSFGSNYWRFLHIDGRRYPYATKTGGQGYSFEQIRRAAEDGVLWGMVIENVKLAKEGLYGRFLQELAGNPKDIPGFKRIPLKGPALMYRFTGKTATPS